MAFQEKNIYLRINLYVIRNLYKSIGAHNQLNDIFKEKIEKGKTRPKGIAEVLNVNKPRFDRIVTTSNNSKIKKEEADSIGRMFNISEEYFLIDRKKLIYKEIPIEEWACFFQDKYNEGEAGDGKSYYNAYTRKSAKEIKEEISSSLERLYKGCKNGNQTVADDIYRVWWYFTKGKSYIDTINERINSNVAYIENITAEEWKRADISVIKNAIGKMETITEGLKAYLLCIEKKFI